MKFVLMTNPVNTYEYTCTYSRMIYILALAIILLYVGQAYRYCQNSNLWDVFINVSECQSLELVQLEEQAVELQNNLIVNDIINVMTFLTEVQNVSEATTNFISTSQEQGPILPNDLNITNNILDAIIW